MSIRPWRHATGRAAVHAARRPLGPRNRGQAVVEFALIFPVFLLLLVIAVDFGRLFFSHIQIHNAAREAAAFGARQPTNDVQIATSAARETNIQAQSGESAISLTSTCAGPGGAAIACAAATGGTGSGNTITVTVSEPFTFFTPFVNGFFGNNLQLRASATAAITDYAPSSGGGQPGACSLPAASFSLIVTSGRTVFADPSGSTPNSGICNISGYNWAWGDGATDVGTATGNAHTYGSDGTYTIVLEVTNQAGPNSISDTVTVPVGPPLPTCEKPVANFTWTTAGNGANKVYTYVDASTVADPTNCPITDWLWTFTDTGLQSNAQNPAPFKYPNGSNHPVTLTVTNAGGSTSITKNT
jgi:Flp pilus assembly protein TadG